MEVTEAPPARPARGRVRALADRYVGELARFGSVGAVAYVVDVGLFNLLRFGPGEVLGHKPLTAKVIAVAVAMVVSYVGSRYWTFSHRRTERPGREMVAFVLVNGVGMLAAVGCLWFSHYVLGLTSPLADNISANVVGLALGTAIRFVAYRQVVFTGVTGQRPDERPAAPVVDERADLLDDAAPRGPLG